MVLFGSLLGDHGFDEDAKAIPVATPFGIDEVDQQVGARHVCPLEPLAATTPTS